MKKIFWGIILFFVLICSFLFVTNFLKYDILTEHDMVFSFGRNFFDPEHGRYVATFLNNLFSEIIPEYLNIHPNDFQPLFVAPFKGILTILFLLLMTNSLFVFSKKKYYMFSCEFILTYVLMFLILFNKHNEYLYIRENAVFFEYPMSFLVYIPLWSYIVYYFVNKKFPDNLNYSIILLLAFFTAISVDPVNIPAFFTLVALGIIFAIIYRKNSLTLKNKLKILGFYIVHISGILIYFVRPSHHSPDWGNVSFVQYANYWFKPFILQYLQSFKDIQGLFILIAFLLILSLIFAKNYKTKRDFIIIAGLNILFQILFCVSTFLIGLYAPPPEILNFYFSCPKWALMHQVSCLFFVLVILGYIIDNNEKISTKLSSFIKLCLCISFFVVIHKNIIISYLDYIKNEELKNKNIRITAYKVEKAAVKANNKSNIINIPVDFKDYTDYLWYDQVFCGFGRYINNVHPEINYVEFEFTDKQNDLPDFTDDELKKLKFQNLIQNKMYRHKKIIKGCY